jgi:hypothetical protein
MLLSLLISFLLTQALAAPLSGSISGVVTFSDGTPAAGLLVRTTPIATIDGPQAGAPARSAFSLTDASGRYRLVVTPGRYYVSFSPNIDSSIYYPGVTASQEADIVTVGDSPVENVDIHLQPSASGVRVTGHVKFPTNDTSQSAKPTVQLSGNSRPRTVPIAFDGTFELTHVFRGNYQLVVSPAPGMQPVRFAVGSEDVRAIELVVPRLVPVSGTVTAENGVPSRFSIGIESAAYRTSVTSSAGSFRAELPAGQYHIALSLTGNDYLKSIAADKTDLQTDLLKVSESDPEVSVKIELGTSAGVRVTGRATVSGPDASRTSMKTVSLVGRAVNETAEAPIAADGSFELAKVRPGVYVARVTLASGLSSPASPVTIPNRDVRDIVIEVPAEIEVRGSVEVDGYGPPPRFSLSLINGSAQLTSAKAGDLPSLAIAALFEALRGGAGTTEVAQMNVSALPDGSFKMKLPQGSYRVTAATRGGNGVPQPYVLRSLTYGGADLLTEPMKLSSERSSELQIGFGTDTPNPWVSVKGKVRGFDPANGPLRVALESRFTSAIEAYVESDGSFEFPRVLTHNSYNARLVPADEAASSPAVSVADKDVTGVEIQVPAQKEVRVVTSMEDNAPAPVFVMTFAGSGSTVTVVGKPGRDGSFRTNLPTDERRIKISGFPLAYKVKSVTYKDADLLKEPLKISKDDVDDLQVNFESDSSLPFGSVSGHISGLDPQLGIVRLELNGVTSFSTFETSVGTDGSFSFSKIPQGTYVPLLAGAGASGFLTPSTIVVSGSDVFSVELTAPSGQAPLNLPPSDDDPTGVTVTSLTGSSQTANESSAVAQLRTINTAEIAYLTTHGGIYGAIPDLIDSGFLDKRFAGTVSGFSFSIIAAGSNYVAAGIPETQSTGRYGFFATPDAIIRFSTLDLLSVPNQAGKPVQ